MLLTKDIRKVFVTGGAGFIGSHVADRLLADGLEVTVYDNLSSGKLKWIEGHLENSRFRFVKADILDADALQAAIRGHDLVWHLAANTDIPSGYSRTDIDLKNCVIGTWNVLEAMRLSKIQPMLFSSTGAIYGELCKTTFTSENAGPILPLSLYAAGKSSCEGFIAAYCALFDLRAWIFRFGNVVGSRMGHGAIYDFIQKLRRSPNELEILGDGRQEKNYFLVDECIDGMAFAFSHAIMTPAKPCDIFNLGTDSVTKVTVIAQGVIEEMALKNVKIRFTGGEAGWPGDQPQVHILSDKMHALGWQAAHSSDEAVRIAIRQVLRD